MTPEEIMEAEGWTQEQYDSYEAALYEYGFVGESTGEPA